MTTRQAHGDFAKIEADDAARRPPAAIAPPGMSARSSWLESRSLFLVLALAAIVPGLLQVFRGADDHDIGWYVYVTGRVLDGARLYVDLIEVNPPLNIVLSMPSVLIARFVGVPAVLVFELFACAMLAVSVLLCDAVMRRGGAADGVVSRRVIVLLLLFVLFAIPSASNVFAQREHFFFALFLPYLFAATRRVSGVRLGARLAGAIGVLAGIGIAHKPYFVLPWALVEAYVALRSGTWRAWLRPETLAIVLIGITYAIAVALFASGYFEVVWLARALYTKFLPVPFTSMFYRWRMIYGLLGIVVALMIPSDELSREPKRILLLATAGFICAVLLQSKGWEYHFYPTVAGATLLLALALRDALRNGRGVVRYAGGALAAICLALLCAKIGKQVLWIARPGVDHLYMSHLTPRVTGIIRDEARGESVYALTVFPFPMFPALSYTDARWAGRFNQLWALSGVYPDTGDPRPPLRYHRPEEMEPAERFVFDAVIDDMLRDPPRLLFVAVAPNPGLPRPEFDFIRYFSQDERFASLMRGYELIDRIGEHDVFRRYGGRRDTPLMTKSVQAR